MKSEIYWINEKPIEPRSLGTMARPRGNDWLEDEIRSLNIRGVDCLVSLLEYTEIGELGLEEEKELCRKWSIDFINFPIGDVKVPVNKNEFIALAKKLAGEILEGKKVVVHCRMGIGRASLLAGAVMVTLGAVPKEVFETIGKYRKLKVPDTTEQQEWLWELSDKLV